MISYSFLSNLTAYFHSADPETLSDRDLFETAQRIGAVALKGRRAFIGLLPLVEKRRAYEGRTFYSIYDFAAKVGGVSRDTVDEVMRVDQYLIDAPKLRRKLYRGEIGWSKIRMIVHWITRTNEDEWIEKLENLSKRALEVYLRDYQSQLNRERPKLELGSTVFPQSSQNILKNGVKFEAKFLPGEEMEKQNNFTVLQGEQLLAEVHDVLPSKLSELSDHRETFTFSMNAEIAARLRLFRQRLEKDRRELVTWEEVMLEFLKMIEGEIHYNEKKKSEKSDTRTPGAPVDVAAGSAASAGSASNPVLTIQKPTTRYIPAAARRQVDMQYSGLCAFKDCARPATIYHHTKRFALTKHLSPPEAHDPNFIKPLCTPHERIIHNTLVENEEIDPKNWKLLATPVKLDSASYKAEIREVDQKVSEYRRPH